MIWLQCVPSSIAGKEEVGKGAVMMMGPNATALQGLHASYLGGVTIDGRTSSGVCAWCTSCRTATRRLLRTHAWQTGHVATGTSHRLAQTLRTVRPSILITSIVDLLWAIVELDFRGARSYHYR